MSGASQSLIDVADSVLVVIDVQAYFLGKLPAGQGAVILDRVAWLIKVATRLDVPLVVTAEDIAALGSVAPELVELLPPDTVIFDKLSFGLAGQADILEAVRATGRNTAILVGLETDVCVAQSALGLLAAGFDVGVVTDAVASPTGQQAGLDRMLAAGVAPLSVKGVYYEWVRTVARNEAFMGRFSAKIGTPVGIIL